MVTQDLSLVALLYVRNGAKSHWIERKALVVRN